MKDSRSSDIGFKTTKLKVERKIVSNLSSVESVYSSPPSISMGTWSLYLTRSMLSTCRSREYQNEKKKPIVACNPSGSQIVSPCTRRSLRHPWNTFLSFSMRFLQYGETSRENSFANTSRKPSSWDRDSFFFLTRKGSQTDTSVVRQNRRVREAWYYYWAAFFWRKDEKKKKWHKGVTWNRLSKVRNVHQ